MLISWSVRQKGCLFVGCILGQGHVRRAGGTRVVQREEEEVHDMMVVLECMLEDCGRCASPGSLSATVPPLYAAATEGEVTRPEQSFASPAAKAWVPSLAISPACTDVTDHCDAVLYLDTRLLHRSMRASRI